MDEGTRTSGPAVENEQRDPEEIRSDIEQTREELGDTVEALAAKTDVKAHAQEKAEEIKQEAREKSVPLAAIGGAVIAALVAWRVIARRRNG
jgi:hypothetical protein